MVMFVLTFILIFFCSASSTLSADNNGSSPIKPKAVVHDSREAGDERRDEIGLVRVAVRGHQMVDLARHSYVDGVVMSGLFSDDNVSLRANHYEENSYREIECNGPYRNSTSVIFFHCSSFAQTLNITGNFFLRSLVVTGFETYADAHVGCYELVRPDKELDYSTLEQCHEACSNSKYFAVSKGELNKCFCLSSLVSAIPRNLHECDVSCSDPPIQHCGGKSYSSVYLQSVRGETDADCLQGQPGCQTPCEPSQSMLNCGMTGCSVNNGQCGKLSCLVRRAAPGTIRGVCGCPRGYKTVRRNCEDIDECRSNKNECDAVTTACFNTDGSHVCNRTVGHARASGRRRRQVTGMARSECFLNADCGPKGNECILSHEGYQCKCAPGFKRTHGGRCADIDECSASDLACDGGTCNNINGSYECHCPENRHRIATEHGYQCQISPSKGSSGAEVIVLSAFALIALATTSIVLLKIKKVMKAKKLAVPRAGSTRPGLRGSSAAAPAK